MRTKSLIINLINEEFDEFKSNLTELLDQKFNDKRAVHVLDTVQGVVMPTCNEVTHTLDYNVIDVLRESIKQKNSMNLILEDNSEVTLRSKDAEKLVLLFDNLNVDNQIKLINRIKKTKVYFEETINFCSKLKRRH